MFEPETDPILAALEDADQAVDLDPQAVAAVGPERVAVRWQAIKAPTLDAALPIHEARVMLLAGGAR